MTLDAKTTLPNVDRAYKGHDGKGKIGDAENNATLAERKLVDAALADSGNDRTRASTEILELVKESSKTGNEGLITKGILPNVALAYLQDDGKVSGAARRRDNFSAIAGADGKKEISLAALQATLKNPNADRIDTLMVQGVLANKNLVDAYFNNKDKNATLKDNQGKEVKTENGKTIKLDGSYTQEEMKAILQYEKVKLASQQNPLLSAGLFWKAKLVFKSI